MWPQQDSELSQYERERNARIAANRQLLADLGLASAIRLNLIPREEEQVIG